MKRDYQYPQHFVVNWVKNSSKKILDITEIFNKGGMSTRVTLSRQSFNEKTLEAVKRKNIKQGKGNIRNGKLGKTLDTNGFPWLSKFSRFLFVVCLLFSLPSFIL